MNMCADADIITCIHVSTWESMYIWDFYVSVLAWVRAHVFDTISTNDHPTLPSSQILCVFKHKCIQRDDYRLFRRVT